MFVLLVCLPGGRQTRDIILEPGKVFGERALLLDEARAANVIAVSATVTCFTIDRHSVRTVCWLLARLPWSAACCAQRPPRLPFVARCPG